MIKSTVLDVNHVLSVCQRRCADHGISVRFDSKADTAYTDGTNIVLPIPCHPIDKDALDTLYGMVIHETGHHLRPEAFNILNAARPPTHLSCLFNITEDDGMERERALAWKGDRVALAHMNALLIEEIAVKWAEHFNQPVLAGTPKQDPAPVAAMTLGQLSRLQWDDESGTYIKKLLAMLPTEVSKLVTELEDEGWVRRFRATATPAQTWDLAVDLAKRLYPNNKEEEYEEIREAGHKGADTRNGTPRDTTSDTMGDAQGKPEASKDKDGAKASDSDGETISWKDCVVSEHKHNEKGNEEPGNLGITWKGRVKRGGVAIMPPNKVNVVDMSTFQQGNQNPRDWRSYMPKNEQTRSFATRIRRYIQARARSVVERDRLHGKLDRSSIVKLALPPIDGGEYNKKIFYTQRKHTMKDTAIFVLVDWSGSMNGHKMVYAADAAQRLVHTFDRVLNVPVALAAFSNKRSICDVGYIKPWNTRGMTEEEIAKRFGRFREYTSGNDDADAVNWAWHQILKRKEKRKILIVLSDGAPAGAWKGHAADALELVTKSVEKDGRVELYGVGICSNAVEDYYTNWKYLKDPSQINETLFNLIKEGDNGKRR